MFPKMDIMHPSLIKPKAIKPLLFAFISNLSNITAYQTNGYYMHLLTKFARNTYNILCLPFTMVCSQCLSYPMSSMHHYVCSQSMQQCILYPMSFIYILVGSLSAYHTLSLPCTISLLSMPIIP